MMKSEDKKRAKQNVAQFFLKQYSEGRHIGRSQLLNDARPKAIDYLQTNGLPIYREEAYQHFKIDDALTHGWSINTQPAPSEEDANNYACRLTYPDAHQAFIIGGKVVTTSHSNGFFAGSISSFIETYPQVAKQYYNQSPSISRAPLTHLNTLFADDLFVFYIRRGTHLDAPLHIIHYPTAEGTSHTLTFPRILVVAEEDSEATLLLCDHRRNEEASAYVGAIEIFAENGAKLHYYNIEESNKETLRIMDTHITQAQGSQVLLDSITIHNGRTRNNYYCNIQAEDASLDLDGLGILDDDMALDNWSEIQHNAPNGHSDQLFKYTMNDTAVGAFSGLIYVAPHAQKTEAYQNNRNLLLSAEAKMYSKPQLEIYADDVKCSHGMTTGQLDELAVFYMQQRGIPEMEAKLMLTTAFMDDVLAKVAYEPLRERLMQTIDSRYRGLPSSCK